MFTGLIERTGKVVSISRKPGANTPSTLIIDPGSPDFARSHGDSIAVNGVCLSDISDGEQSDLLFHVSEETFNRTSLGELKEGSLVNLERSLSVNQRFGGHFVLGHIDETGTIISLENLGSFWYLKISLSRDLSRYVVSKGSIALDGVSLTVNQVVDAPLHSELAFTLVPVTWETTRFKAMKVGDKVNIEVDVLAKHVERLVERVTERVIERKN